MSFCQNCGNPLAAGVAFCTRCGAAAASAMPAKRTGIGKGLLIAGGIVALLVVLGAAGAFYAAYRVKQKLAAAGVSSAPAPAYAVRRAADPCSLLPASEAARITGFQVDRTEKQQDDCLYFGSAGQAAEKGRAQAEEAMQKMRSNSVKDDREAARVMEDFMKGVAASGASGQSGQVLKITVKYGDEARQEESAVRLALGLLGAPQGAKSSPVEGVGDRAYLLPMAVGLHMAKGDAYVMIEGPAAPSRETLIAVAQAIAARL
ncbi:MAG: zinc ribbon domain-containing protein [Bryobacteraceae bacterium]|nr:zinc ribbon domain-containing protein [Bryobacteraceae bacterium]